MPLEISEIGVHMAVRDPGDGPAASGPARPGGGSAGAGSGGCAQPGGLTGAQRDALVQECVRAVLRALSMREAR
jgi:Family of unknown function (DUF5908)